MNSRVSVEEQDEDISLDEFDSFVFSASNVSESSVDSDRSGKKSPFLSNQLVNESSLTNNLVLCTNSGVADEKTAISNRRTSRRKPNRKKNRRNPRTNISDSKLIPVEDNDSNIVDVSGLPLNTILMNYPVGDKHSSPLLPESETDLSIERKLLYDSDAESNSFGGFSDNSNSSFEGFVNKSTSVKPTFHTQSFIFQNSDRFSPFTKQISRPSSSILSSTSDSSSSQNYSKSLISSVHPSAPQESEEEANASRTRHKKSKKENLGIDCAENNFITYRTELESDEKIRDLPNMIFLDDSEDESFEGFGSENDRYTQFNNNSYIQTNIDADETAGYDRSDNMALENQSIINESDFIGDYCNNIGCTISWLETNTTRKNPAKITNGIVYELSEFAKSIAWESDYIAIWILRLRGYKNINIENDDRKKINSVIKRRKSLSVTFAGYANLKAKLSTFDSELFTLPSVERLDRVKLTKYNPKLVSTGNLNETTKPESLKFLEKENFSPKQSNNITSATEIMSKMKTNSNDNYKKRENDSIINKDIDKDSSQEELEAIDLSDNELFDSDSDSEGFDILDKNSSLAKYENIKNKSEYSGNSDTVDSYERIIKKSSKGRIRKLTAKAQESYSWKQNHEVNSSSSDESSTNTSPLRDVSKTSIESHRTKLLHPTFTEDIKVIGPYCKVSGIDLKLLNSFDKASSTITNGVVYELYYFFRQRKASLTSLVHTLYRLKDIPIDKCHIIATMAKIHEMVKVMWAERINRNPEMPYEEFHLSERQDKEMNNSEVQVSIDNVSLPDKTNEFENLEPKNKKKRLDHENVKTYPEIISQENSDKNADSPELKVIKSSNIPQDMSKDSRIVPKVSGPMSNTFGYEGKITRGDIVYLYTKWLKKKMESQSNVFVTDLSKDVEDLIIDRKVEFIRIPVGTLMSSSVKLFEEFRKLSKSDMYEAKAYLLEDWIEDIKSILSSKTWKSSANASSNSDDNKELLKFKVPCLSESKDPEYSSKALSTDLSHFEDYHYTDIENCSDNDSNFTSKHNELDRSKASHPLIKNIDPNLKVEKIVGYRVVKIGEGNVTEYRIRWKGLSSKEDSWINETDLNCLDILSQFWEALIKQRASRAKREGMATDLPIPVSSSEKNMQKIKENASKAKNVLKGQENLASFFGRENNSSQKFFNLMVDSLNINMVDYQHEEENLFPRKGRITKGDILNIYNSWRYENQEHLFAGGNKKIDLGVLKSRVKDLMEVKRVRNFNPSCLLDVCYRMSLMEAKLKDPEKVKEYLSGDFLEMMQIGQKHQDTIRKENASILKKLKQNNMVMSSKNQRLIEKIKSLDRLERESLIIAKFLKENRSVSNLEEELERKITVMKKVLDVEDIDLNDIEILKKQNQNIVKELESSGVDEGVLDDILSIALKID